MPTATLALVHSKTEYCASVWCRSAHTHLTDPTINDALQIATKQIATGPIPVDNLLILAGIQPAELRRKGATLSLAISATEPGHQLHSALTCPPSANARRLKSRHPFVPAAQQLISSSDNNNIRAALWVDHQWNAEWLYNTTRHRTFIPDTGAHPPQMSPPKQRGPGLTASAPVSGVSAPACTDEAWSPLRLVSECGAEEQTVDHAVLQCPIHRSPHGLHGLVVLDDETIEWQLNNCPDI